MQPILLQIRAFQHWDSIPLDTNLSDAKAKLKLALTALRKCRKDATELRKSFIWTYEPSSFSDYLDLDLDLESKSVLRIKNANDALTDVEALTDVGRKTSKASRCTPSPS